MVKYAPTPVMIVKFITIKETRVSFRITDARTARMCPSVCLFLALCFSVPLSVHKYV